MILIPLTKGQFAKIDDDDFEMVSMHSWCASTNSRGGYYAQTRINNKIVLMHRFVMNTPPELECDHIHHDTLDNRKSELRNVTHVVNMTNRMKANSNNATGVLGVSIDKHGSYLATIVDPATGKQVYLKASRTDFQAVVKARKDAELKYFGKLIG
jgi:hypothetical protein